MSVYRRPVAAELFGGRDHPRPHEGLGASVAGTKLVSEAEDIGSQLLATFGLPRVLALKKRDALLNAAIKQRRYGPRRLTPGHEQLAD